MCIVLLKAIDACFYLDNLYNDMLNWANWSPITAATTKFTYILKNPLARVKLQ